jgi:hypothetical protein
VESANAKASAREEEARRGAESATRARDKALSELRAAKDDISRARDDAAASRADARAANDAAAAARAELSHVKATLEVRVQIRACLPCLHACLLRHNFRLRVLAPQHSPARCSDVQMCVRIDSLGICGFDRRS